MAFAQTGSGIDAIKNTNNAVGLQYISTNVNYTETSNGVTLDTEKGNVPGFAINFSYMQDWLFGNDYLAASYSQNNGNTFICVFFVLVKNKITNTIKNRLV